MKQPLVLAMAVAVLLAACGGEATPTSTPTPTPVPTPTPLPPIAVDEGATNQDILQQFPAAEQQCIRQGLGEEAFDQLLQQGIERLLSEAGDGIVARCASQESLVRFFIGILVAGTGGLSNEKVACLRDTFSAFDLNESGEAATQEALGCLNDEERARAIAGGLFGEEGVPGLVDVGGYRLYLTCEGEGDPAVVLVAGGRGASATWELVQPDVAGFARVCSYDRAGAGKSDPGPDGARAQEIAQELHILLANANVDGPYVLVGHSLGGILARYFARLYPQELVGMVLVDTSHGDPEARLEAVLTPEERRLLELLRGLDFTLPEGLDLTGPDLGDLPLVVLSAGRPEPFLPPDLAKRIDRLRLAMQRELAALSTNSTHIIAQESGHSIQRDQPELVIDAIQQVVRAARSR